jgi:hypothetical protein
MSTLIFLFHRPYMTLETLQSCIKFFLNLTYGKFLHKLSFISCDYGLFISKLQYTGFKYHLIFVEVKAVTF